MCQPGIEENPVVQSYSVVPKVAQPHRPRVWPKQSLKLCGYVCFEHGFVDVTGSRTEFPASPIAFSDRFQIVRDALLFLLEKKFPVGSVIANGVLLATASATDKYAFHCDNHAAIVCPPAVYASVVSEEWEDILFDDLINERDPRTDAILQSVIGSGNIHLFMHMYGYGEGTGPGCIPCRTVVEACRADQRRRYAGHRYIRFDEEFVSLGNFFELCV
jgi:hypothetical protein